ncbi:Sodium channel and clathrin linker 1 [Platysternon megacephalum]|uniref:Sodium channel and clathrin linker 1 n=1 Tax=Platysternon megacephalum TaxID=55544 RepID=A0A4D9FA92_9SAUR|nr:Sodium channel and clathrin linker 1 [Platysternon megacephalum]
MHYCTLISFFGLIDRSELSRQKLHTQELISQLEMANEKIAENEKLMMEHQEKVNRLQRRLTQAEQRAAIASQQLCLTSVISSFPWYARVWEPVETVISSSTLYNSLGEVIQKNL